MNLSIANQAFASPPQVTLTAVLEPRFALKPGGTYVIGSQVYVLERRLGGGHWQFMAIETREPYFATDLELARLLREGLFFLERGAGGQCFAPPPLSPIAVGASAHAANQRKHSYVVACWRPPSRCLRCATAAPIGRRGWSSVRHDVSG